MRLAVVGRQPLDELQAMVEAAFGGVANQQLPVPSFPPDIYTEQVGAGGLYIRRPSCCMQRKSLDPHPTPHPRTPALIVCLHSADLSAPSPGRRAVNCSTWAACA